MMVKKMWPALKSCKHQCNEAKDQLSRLTDDLLLLIMSFLTMKEAARTSVISHRWTHLWRCFPLLIFEDHSAKVRISEGVSSLPQERSIFLRWVNQVVDAHQSRNMDELKVASDLDHRNQSDMDKWVAFALAKQVKRLELDFEHPFREWDSSPPKWSMPLDQSLNLCFLRSLCLKYVDVTTNDIDCVLRSCMVLENLCIHLSLSLRYIRASGSSLHLKHLEVSQCPYLETIDIVAPKLLSFVHHGKPIELQIRSASLLSEVSVGDEGYKGDIVAYAYDSLSKYFSQLKYLSWHMQLLYERFIDNVKDNLGINNPPAMTNLKHLELQVTAKCEESLLGWLDLIEASPLLERLTIKISLFGGTPDRKIVKRNGRPLNSLKTLDLRGDLGFPIDLELATYVVENSVMLKDVIVKFRPLPRDVFPSVEHVSVQDQVEELKQMVPQGVKFSLHMVNPFDYWERFNL